MLIRNARLGELVKDIFIENGIITQIGTGLIIDHNKNLRVFDAKGGAVLPGLHDHHIHLNASAAAMMSVSCGPPDVTTKAELIAAIHSKKQGWLRGIGYHPSVAGAIDRAWLDRYGPKRPVRIQHRSGRLWICNSAAMDELGLSEPINGRLLDGDDKLRIKLDFPDLTPCINKLLSYGITGVTEVTPSNGAAEYQHYCRAVPPLRLSIMGNMQLTAKQSPYLKLHYHECNLPALSLLINEISKAYDSGRNIAAHCVTRAELMLTLAAIDAAGGGIGDRIEHAAIADQPAIDWMSKLGVTVVTQPNFIAERHAAYIKEVPKRDHQNLWRLKSFVDAGLPLAAGNDAPFGEANPWLAMAAAINRPRGFESEAIDAKTALALYTKPCDNAGAPPRAIELGARADLCCLDRSWDKACKDLAAVKVMATWIDGKLAYMA